MNAFADAKGWRSIKLAEKRHFDKTGIMPNMTPVLQEMKFRDFAQWRLDHRVALRSTKRTCERYADNLKHHVYPLMGDLWLSQIVREHADQLVQKLRESNHNPVGTNLVVGVLKQVMNEAFKQEKITKYPFPDYGKVKEPKRPDQYMSKEENERFLAVNKVDIVSFGGAPVAPKPAASPAKEAAPAAEKPVAAAPVLRLISS